MILGRQSSLATQRADVDIIPLFGASDEEIASKEQQAIEEIAARERRNFLLFGLAGVAIGSVVTGGIVGLSFRSYKRSGSALGPAIYTGVGSAASTADERQQNRHRA